MGEVAAQKNTYSIEEYFALEEKSQARHEYHQGGILAMAGATLVHNEITGNVYMKLRSSLSNGNCRTFMENVKLEVIKDSFYAYPDVMVTCDARDQKETLVQHFPVLLVEVSSNATEESDRVIKLRRYREIPTLRYYLLVDQYEHCAELYTYQSAQRNAWLYQSFYDLAEEINFPELSLTIKLSEIYQGITLAEGNEPDAPVIL